MDINWDPNRNDQPVAVVSIWIGETLYYMPTAEYDDNIQAGKTEYVTIGSALRMVTPEDAKLLRRMIGEMEKKKAKQQEDLFAALDAPMGFEKIKRKNGKRKGYN